MTAYQDDANAVRIANDTPYGLSSYVASKDLQRACHIAKRIRAGNVHINGERIDLGGCFGGYKQSGNGREWGRSRSRGVSRTKGGSRFPSACKLMVCVVRRFERLRSELLARPAPQAERVVDTSADHCGYMLPARKNEVQSPAGCVGA
jgi:hypothetical protein